MPEAVVPFTSRVVAVEWEFIRRPFLRPLRLSSVTITEITEARATVTVETPAGQTATGRGAIYLSDLWAWPGSDLPPAERDAAMRAFSETSGKLLTDLTREAALHPLEAGLRLHDALLQADSPLPPLARLVSASPVDAALHDAVGRAYGVSAFDLYEGVEAGTLPTADAHFLGAGAGAAVRALLRRPPVAELDATLVVGKGDALSELDAWAGPEGRGYRCFKLKVGGVDPNEDARRVSEVFRHARALGVASPRLSVDANCASPDDATVAAFLEILERQDPEAFAAMECLEQPTGRDIHTHAFDWRTVAARRPLLLDEGLTDWPDLQAAEAQGWNGLAVKTCRGHSFALATAVWAHQRGWKLAAMDLTNPGISAVHSALLAAHLPGVDLIEMNAAQYTPAANEAWLPRLGALLAPANGTHHLPSPPPVGLGSDL